MLLTTISNAPDINLRDNFFSVYKRNYSDKIYEKIPKFDFKSYFPIKWKIAFEDEKKSSQGFIQSIRNGFKEVKKRSYCQFFPPDSEKNYSNTKYYKWKKVERVWMQSTHTDTVQINELTSHILCKLYTTIV